MFLGHRIEGVTTLPPAEVPGGARRARLQVTRVDPWSTAKVAFVLSVGLAVAIIIAITVLWLLFSVAGVFDSVGRVLEETVGSTLARFWQSPCKSPVFSAI